MIGIPWEANGDAFATLYPEMVDKLIIADIGTQILSATPSIYFGGLNAVDFAKNQVDLK
jgi:hypothetical protein